jgi:hypothetical protein
MEDCEDIDEISHTTPTSEIIETKYKYSENITLSTYLNKKKREPKPNNRYLQTLITSHIQLLESIEILNKSQIIHFNIHPDIILYDSTNATPIITDFRMAFTQSDLNDSEKSAELFPVFENPFWAPEIHEIAKILDDRTKAESREETQESPVEEPDESIMQGGESSTLETLKATNPSWDIYAVNKLMIELTQDLADIPFMTKYRELCSQHPAEPNLKQSIEEMFQSIPKSEYELFMTQMYKSIFIPKHQDEGEPLDESLDEPSDTSSKDPIKTPLQDDTNLGINPDAKDKPL